MLRTLENYFEGFIIKANHYRPNSSLYITALSVKIAIYSDFDKFCKSVLICSGLTFCESNRNCVKSWTFAKIVLTKMRYYVILC